MKSVLPQGIHCYDKILEDIALGDYCFAKLKLFHGREVDFIGFSEVQLDKLRSQAEYYQLYVILYGSRVAGPRTHQHKLHPILKEGVSLHSTSRSASVGFPQIENTIIRKDAIKELGISHPQTSDVSIVVFGKSLIDESQLLRRAIMFEKEINNQLNINFPIRVYRRIFNCSFSSLEDFIKFGREKYIKKDLPKNHGYSDSEIDEAFSMIFSVL